MISVVALRHVAFENLGVLEDIFAKRKWKTTYIEVPTADLSKLDPLKPDLLVILGGPIGVNQDQDYPFIAQELALLQQRLDADKPTLGICLGAQLIARSLGAEVYRGTKEIGWMPLLLTAAGQAAPTRHLAAHHTFMFHWHGETFDLPKGATLLAGTEACHHQAFSWGKGTLAFQCHPEVRHADLESWFVGHAVEIEAASAAFTVRKLRRDSFRYGPTLERQGTACFNEWLDALKLA